MPGRRIGPAFQHRLDHTPGRFNLIGTASAPIEDVKLEWARQIEAMLPIIGGGT